MAGSHVRHVATLREEDVTRSVLTALCLLEVLSCISCTCSRRQAPATEPNGAPTAPVDGGVPARTSRPSSEHNRTSPIGSNIERVVDYSRSMPFVDLFKSSRPWISGAERQWDDGRSIDLDENGWVRSLKPGQVARTLVLTNEGHPGGEFIVLYEGEGKIEHNNELLQNRSRPGRHVIHVDKNGSVGFEISQTNPRNPIRNIRVLPPGGSCEEDDARWCDRSHPCPNGSCLPFEQTYQERIFHPKFLQAMSRYAVLRFMDWMRTNDSRIRTWSERPKVTDATWWQRGVPIEVMMSLAKRLRAEPWVNIPHLADDDFVARFASLVHNTLPEDFRVWIEYSNEVWNPQFDQYHEVAQCPAGKRENGEYGAMLVCQAERADAVFRSWRQIFGESASRVIRVVGTQSSETWASERLLMHQKLHERVDALAIAPYFGLLATRDNEAELARLSVDELLERTADEILPRTIKYVQSQSEVAQRFGLALVAYEGGQHFSSAFGVENNEKINDLFDVINRHPGMKDLYLRYLAAWREAGGQLFVHYTDCGAYTQWGRWGLREYIDQPRAEAPKLDAVMQFIEQNPLWW